MANPSVGRKTSKRTPVLHDTSESKKPIIRRYTTLPALFHILHTHQITLLNPASWDDRNDAFFMNEYKDQMKAQSVLALCFSTATETYHHWRVFTHGSEGVCIEFERKRLVAELESAGVQADDVAYKRIDTLEAKHPSVEALPFLKRLPYEAEREFRLVYLDRSRKVEAQSFPVDLKSIRRITLSPWMPKALVGPVKTTIQSIAGCSKMKVHQTTLLENERWKHTAIRSRAN